MKFTIQNAAQYDQLLQEENNLLVVAFLSRGSGNSTLMLQILDEISSRWGEQVKITTIDFDQSQSLAQQLLIDKTPSLLFYKFGDLYTIIRGIVSKQLVERQVESILTQ